MFGSIFLHAKERKPQQNIFCDKTHVKELLSFFINHVFVGVFQYDCGTPKHTLELKKKSEFFGFCPKERSFHGLVLKAPPLPLQSFLEKSSILAGEASQRIKRSSTPN